MIDDEGKDLETPEAPAAGRPVGLTIACVFGGMALALALAALAIRWDVLRRLPPGRQALALAAPAILLLSLIGFWRVRRWALWLILVAVLARLGATALGLLPLELADLMLPGALLLVGAMYWRRLR